MRAALKMNKMSIDEREDFIRTPHFFNLYMAGMGIMFYRCIECTRGCVASEMPPEYAGDIPRMNNATTLDEPFGMDLTIYDKGKWDPAKLKENSDEKEKSEILSIDT